MNLASVVEKADEQVLPAVYYFVGRSLNATPAQLGTLTLCRALVQVQTTAFLPHLKVFCSQVELLCLYNIYRLCTNVPCCLTGS